MKGDGSVQASQEARRAEFECTPAATEVISPINLDLRVLPFPASLPSIRSCTRVPSHAQCLPLNLSPPPPYLQRTCCQHFDCRPLTRLFTVNIVLRPPNYSVRQSRCLAHPRQHKVSHTELNWRTFTQANTKYADGRT